MKIYDLRTDTITKPSEEMRKAYMKQNAAMTFIWKTQL